MEKPNTVLVCLMIEENVPNLPWGIAAPRPWSSRAALWSLHLRKFSLAFGRAAPYITRAAPCHNVEFSLLTLADSGARAFCHAFQSLKNVSVLIALLMVQCRLNLWRLHFQGDDFFYYLLKAYVLRYLAKITQGSPFQFPFAYIYHCFIMGTWYNLSVGWEGHWRT